MYYVYEFFIIETDEVIYVGKGKGRRYKVTSQRNELLNYMLHNYKCGSRIIKTFQDEKDAFMFEYEYIKQMREKGLCVCNIHVGGAGGSGEYWTDELRKEYSENNVMKSKEQKKRMSVNNPMKNSEVAEKVGKTKRRPVIIGDKEYSSVKQASIDLKVATDTVISWCRKGVSNRFEKCRYKDSEQIDFNDKRFNKGSCRSLTYKGRHYESPVDLAEELGCNVTKLYHWLKNGFDHYGVPIRYDDDNRELVFERKKGANHPVIANGKHYPSISHAARALGTTSQWLGEILRGKHTSPNYTCEYDNQQPSQENVDNSILEGSTTNG